MNIYWYVMETEITLRAIASMKLKLLFWSVVWYLWYYTYVYHCKLELTC